MIVVFQISDLDLDLDLRLLPGITAESDECKSQIKNPKWKAPDDPKREDCQAAPRQIRHAP